MKKYLAALVLCLAARAESSPGADALSRALLKDFRAEISRRPSGRELYARLERSGPAWKKLRVEVAEGAGPGNAMYDPESNAIRLGAAPLAAFLGLKPGEAGRAAGLLAADPRARSALAGRADSTFVHELVHALQSYLYPGYRRDVPGGAPLEFEYEAYMTESMYASEKLRDSPALLSAFLRGSGRDVYTVSAMNALLALSLDPEAHKEKIRALYEDELGGFISLEKAENLQKSSVEDSKILAYASGRTGEYSDKRSRLRGVSSEKEAYDRFLEDFYRRRWPSFSAGALFFLGTAALEEKVYPLALECLAGADARAKNLGVPEKQMLKLREKGALAVLEAAAYVRDRAGEMELEDLAAHIRALETACANTGRPFPEELAQARDGVYPKAAEFYSRKAAAEKNRARARAYAEKAAYFRRGPAARR